MDYLKEIKSLVEIFRDLGLNAGYYYNWATERHVVFIETRPELTSRLQLMSKDPEILLKNLIQYTSGFNFAATEDGCDCRSVS